MAIRQEQPPSPDPPPDAEAQPTTPKKLSTSQIAEAILATEHFALDAGRKLYAYEDGVYVSGGKGYLKQCVKRFLKSRGRSEEWSNYRANEVRGYIEADAPQLWPHPPLSTLNVLNGLLDIETGTLWPHDPAHLSPIQLSVEYDPDARCPYWEQFSKQVLPRDARDILFEMAAWLMLPNRNVQKAVLLLGEGANGKSTALAALVAFLGAQNVVGLSLQKLERDRFATARLVGKLANVCADLPTSHLDSTSTFKALTGDDPVLTAEHKHLESFEFDCFARLVFSANQPPRSSDSSEGFFRRWLVVPFDCEFGEKNAIPREELDRGLHAPAELSGVLNRALELLPGVHLSTNLTETASMKAARALFRQTTDPLGVWLDRNTVVSWNLFVPCTRVFEAYNTHASRNGQPPLNSTRFGRSMKQLRPRMERLQRTVDGKLQWCYVGLGMRAR